MIKGIVATDLNLLIALNRQMPWGEKPVDGKHFREKTLNQTVVMGRKTYESIGRPLPDRNNIVMSQQDIEIPGVRVAPTVKEVLDLYKQLDHDLWVIGGSQIYYEFFPYVEEWHVTTVVHKYDVREEDSAKYFYSINPFQSLYWKQEDVRVEYPTSDFPHYLVFSVYRRAE